MSNKPWIVKNCYTIAYLIKDFGPVYKVYHTLRIGYRSLHIAQSNLMRNAKIFDCQGKLQSRKWDV